jgi:site-specific DNA-methyltransferase (adenine-specific)/modification methylase
VRSYYEDDSVTIYHGDSREFVSTLEADVLVTDPPYGISYSPSQNSAKAWGNKTFVGKTVVAGDDEPFDPSPLLRFPTVVLFGANHYADKLPASSGWFVWDKRDGMTSNDFADCELVWSNLPKVARLLRHQWNGALRASERGEPRLHPTQKPLVLMRWILSQCPDGSVLDPYMGSGTTLRAAKDLGRPVTGIDIDERYCEIAAKRCAQEVLC